MQQTFPTVVHFKGMEADKAIRKSIEKRGGRLGHEFREIAHLEITLEERGTGYSAHGRAGGKMTAVESHATASKLPSTVDRLLARLQPRLHDKRIFTRRRTAQRDPVKRSEPD